MKGYILPEALRLAAMSGENDPAWIGGIVLALAGVQQKLDKGQRVILAMCQREINEKIARRDEKRALAAKRTARYREKLAKTPTMEKMA